MPDLSLEASINGTTCGIDEVGRGPLVGPVTAACVHIPKNVQDLDFWQSVTDSKKLSAKKRKELAELIKQHCPYGIAESTVSEIDEINILQASLLAMQRAYEAMNHECDHALIDGNKSPELPCSTQTVIKGDTKILSIAAASIIAKVHRDQYLEELSQQYPHYGWERNAGYGTKEHLTALDTHGITPHHRASFAPIKKRLSA